MRPMPDAPKTGTPVLAKIRSDLAAFAPHYGWSRPAACAGLRVVVCHPGISEDGFDVGWRLAGPFGHGLGEDEIFEGWWPLPEERDGPGSDDLSRLEGILQPAHEEAFAFTKTSVLERLPQDWELEMHPDIGILIFDETKCLVPHRDLSDEMQMALSMVETLRSRTGILTMCVASQIQTKPLIGNSDFFQGDPEAPA